MTKYKGLGGIGAHLDRDYVQHNVDGSKSSMNSERSGLGGIALERAVEDRIASGYTKQVAIRKDAVRAVGVILTGSHERMKEIEADKKLFDAWKTANYEFACQEFGQENIVRFTVHRDEKTPHIHCVFVPITKDGRLSAKEYMKGKECMRGYQDRYGKKMEKFGLERGLSREITQTVHIPTDQYYRDTNLLMRKSEEKAAAISMKNILKLDKVRKEVGKTLNQEYRLSEDYRRRAGVAERSLKNLFKEDIYKNLERVKCEVNLVQHAKSMGYELDKKKSCRRYAVMNKDGDKVVINTRPNRNGHWVYMSVVSERDKGTVVDFMLNRGYEYRDIRNLSSIHLDDGLLKELNKKAEVVEDKTLQEKLSKGALMRVREEDGLRYLEKRKIDERSYKGYLGKSMELGGGRAVFGLYREVDSEGNGKLCSTISYGYDQAGKSKKYFQAGLPRGLSVLKEEENPKKVIITESPIDALSYKQQYEEKDAVYISTCGNLTGRLKEEIGTVLKGAKARAQDVVLAFDKDEAGMKMSKKLETMCKELSLLCSVRFPTQGKDWNKELEEEVKKGQHRSNSMRMSMRWT